MAATPTPIKDNTISDPAVISPRVVGDSYLIPAYGGEGAWAGRADYVATWRADGTWLIGDVAVNTTLLVTSGPNAGRAYKRTSVPHPDRDYIPNGDFTGNPFASSDWLPPTVLFGEVSHDAAGGNLKVYTDATTLSEARVRVLFPTVEGTRYRATFVIDSTDVNGVDSTISWTIGDQVFTGVFLSGNFTGPGEQMFDFVATSTQSYIELYQTSAYVEATTYFDSIGVIRLAQAFVDGNLDSGPAFWNIPTPWLVDTSLANPAPFQGNVARITFDGPESYDPWPALGQTVPGIGAGNPPLHRLDFFCTGDWSDGFTAIQLAMMGTVIHDFPRRNGWQTHYFTPAGGVDIPIDFPISFSSGLPFSTTVDRFYLSASLYKPEPMIDVKGTAHGYANVHVMAVKNMALRGVGKSEGGMNITQNMELTMTGAGKSSASVRLEKGQWYPLTLRGASKSAGVMRLAMGRSLSLPGKGISRASVNLADLGYYTVKMAVDSILNLWSSGGCGCGGPCSPMEVDALEKLNAAIQKLEGSGQNWGWVSTHAINVRPLPGEREIALPRNVIHVKRAVFRPALTSLPADETPYGSFPLRPMKSRHEIEAFRLQNPKGVWPLSENESFLAGVALPLGYFTEAEDLGDGTTGGPPMLRLMLGPEFVVPDVPWSVDVQVAILPPRYGCPDIKEKATALAIPYRFAESILLPLARYYALSSRYFRREELRAGIVEQAQGVLTLLGELQPAQPQAAHEPRKK